MIVALLFAVLIHATLASFTGLTSDEAHYLLYAQFLDWSYFDHPPLVGWLQAPLIALTDSVAVIRLVPQLVWIVCAWLIHRITEDLSHDKIAASLAVILFCVSPILHIHGIALLPDTLLCLFSLLAAWLSLSIGRKMWKADGLDNNDPMRNKVNLWHWVLLGVLLGLAGLSKYSAIFLAAGLAIYFFIALKGRLPFSGFTIAVGVGILVVSPVFLWNLAHDWISFRYQGSHIRGESWQPKMVLIFITLQCLVFGPLTVWGLVRFWRRRVGALVNPNSIWLLSVFVVPVLILGYLAGGGRSLPYWTSPAWVLAIPFAAIGFASVRPCLTSLNSRVTLLVLTALGLVQITLITWVSVSLILGRPFGATEVSGHADQSDPTNLVHTTTHSRKAPNPFAEVHGWDNLGDVITVLARETGTNVLAIGNWTLGSRLGWYARPLPVWITDSRFDQFDLWFNKPKDGEPVLFVNWSGMPTETEFSNLHNCNVIQKIPIQHFGELVSHFTISRCLAGNSPSK